jgi:hypothetical protein
MPACRSAFDVGRATAQVEFEFPGDYEDCLRLRSILGAHVAKRCFAIDKKTAAHALLVLNDPIPSPVLSHHEQRRPTPRGRFALLSFHHCHFLFSSFLDHCRQSAAPSSIQAAELRRIAPSTPRNVRSPGYEFEMTQGGPA